MGKDISYLLLPKDLLEYFEGISAKVLCKIHTKRNYSEYSGPISKS